MRHLALFGLVLPFALTACAVSDKGPQFAKANSLMKQEIDKRIAQIEYQHQRELLDNMLWLATKAGEQAIPSLLPALKHQSPKVRSSAVWTLCKIGDRRVIPYLREASNDRHVSVRLEVARTLVYLGDMSSVPSLIEGLDSNNLPIRYNCHMALKDATRRDFGYDHLVEDDRERRTAVLQWRQWWGKQSGDPWFAQSYARQYGLPPAGEQIQPKNPETQNPVMQPGQRPNHAKPMGETQPGQKQPTTQQNPKTYQQLQQPQPAQKQPTQKPTTQQKPPARQKDSEDIDWESIEIPVRNKKQVEPPQKKGTEKVEIPLPKQPGK